MRKDCSACKSVKIDELANPSGIGKFTKWFCTKANRRISEFAFGDNPALPLWCPLKKEAEDVYFDRSKRRQP